MVRPESGCPVPLPGLTPTAHAPASPRADSWSRTRRATAAALIGLALAACVEPGSPWGMVPVQLSVGLSGPETRFDTEGRVITSRDYRVAVTRVAFEVDEVALVAGTPGVSRFDPANPPPGYSLCHNGHCHHDDGRLVDYADIAAEVAGGASGAATLGLLAATAPVESGGAGYLGVALGPCAGDAALPSWPETDACLLAEPATLSVARVVLGSLRVEGRFFDSLSGDGARLPEDGVPFAATLPEAAPWRGSVSLDAAFGPGHAAERALTLQLSLDASAFDGLDVGALASDPAALSAALSRGLEAALTLNGSLSP
jgi:hypothetical protein